ncbi:RNA polymerase recycling motor HelD [Aneurinibacillus aneurinilyticus]|nr:RNA polymerase recycling motor HelD [Aneurinibacillus aneurinilyticus]MED0706929.1 RNA polymerase recycling motor HelD [Aneurinibacillus aneurinilyticus]MED0721967.1 RNA polymerase recycling motor HelD [Aneurinibacillus aneurinilyticus]MED0731192.1 RNA polymerase recycling motor HelD [Aneurinibacillus aneurinilyticus]MED0744039.1 RNA polymerase recycling motor HelD [Aneurinibacillus aneurinilyticus]
MGTNQEWQEEQQRVERVVDQIGKQIDTLQQYAGEIKAEVVDIRKNFWDDVTVNFDDAHEAAETYASMKQQAEVLSERERSHRHAKERLTTLGRLLQSPYFGRIDFAEAGEKTERIYLGIASLLDEDEEDFLIYDWRAPISSLYYDYPPGPAQYEAPGGTITGMMELKRQYVIRNSCIRSMFDTGITIGDELLQEVLGKQANTQMKSIVATIQKEQNRIIRNERSRLLIVQGAAGSGKTSAALQRVAYLLYRYRETLQAEQIVLFSPNPMFNSYVSTVLPELGEKNMQQTTFQEYLERRLGKSFHLEDTFAQMEYALSAMDELGYAARIEGIRYKAGSGFMEAIERYVSVLGKEGMIFKDIKFRGEVLFSAEYIKEQFYALDSTLRISNRIKLLADKLLEELKERARLEQMKPWVEDEIELLDKEAYLEAYKNLKKKNRYTENTFDDFERERKLLAKMVVQKYFKPLQKRVKQHRFLDMLAMYRQLFTNPQYITRFTLHDELPERWTDICIQTIERLERSELAYEDATPYLYLQEQLEGFQANTLVRHVFIDEAQDYSPFQFAFIKRLFPRSKVTALGDLNQSIYVHASINDGLSALSSLYEEGESEAFVLTRSYRSTRQIVEFTRGLIDGGEEIEPFNRDGDKPTVTQASDMTELIRSVADRIRILQAAGHQTIAVICKTAKESQDAYKALSASIPLRLIGKETSSYETGVLIIPSYLAKGVEFDAVIIYNASKTQYGRESERKLFYTACTRAMHELHIHFVEEMSPFIYRVPSETYSVVGKSSN